MSSGNNTTRNVILYCRANSPNVIGMAASALAPNPSTTAAPPVVQLSWRQRAIDLIFSLQPHTSPCNVEGGIEARNAKASGTDQPGGVGGGEVK